MIAQLKLLDLSHHVAATSGDLVVIFSNLEQLLAFNEQFLQSLQAEYAQKKRLGIVFKEVPSTLLIVMTHTYS
jgi:hypothetical protein